MRNVVDRVAAGDRKNADSLTVAVIERVLEHLKDDRYAIAWMLALG